MRDCGSGMRIHYCLWTLKTELLRAIGSLKPNFLHEFHESCRCPTHISQTIIDKIDKVNDIVEIVIAMFSFLYSRSVFPTEEFASELRSNVNFDNSKCRAENLRLAFALKLEAVNEEVELISSETNENKAKIDMSTVDGEYEYNDFYDSRGIFVYVYDQILELFSDTQDIQEDFDDGFFSLYDNEIKRKSDSFALRAGLKNRWRFNRTRGLLRQADLSQESVDLILSYERFLFESSTCGTLRWIFNRVNAVMIRLNERTIQPEQDCCEARYVGLDQKDEVEFDEDTIPPHGWETKESKPPKKLVSKKRKYMDGKFECVPLLRIKI